MRQISQRLSSSLRPVRPAFWLGLAAAVALRINDRRRMAAGPQSLRASSTLALSLLLITLPALSQEQCQPIDPAVQQLLQAMSNNAQRVDYGGVVTLQRGSDMQIVELSHRVSNGSATEELSRLTGQDVRVSRSLHPTDCSHPGHELLRDAMASDESVCGLAKSYRFQLSGGDRIAGRQALRLRVDPRDMYRFGYIFELDRETALLLKSTTLSADQRVLEQFQFASLSMVDTHSSAEAVLEHEAEHPHPAESGRPRVGPAWDIAWLPNGFMATDSVPAESTRKTFTDGFASFSVFLEALKSPIKPGEGVERQGSTVAYTRGVTLQGKPVLVTVLGEIPTNTARMVADSVRLR